MENLHLHFALSEHDQDKEYFIQGHGKKEKLESYAANPAKFQEHRLLNAALALVPESHQKMITHYVENIQLPKDSVTRLTITTPARNPTDILPDLVAMHIHVPQEEHKQVLLQAGHENTPTPMVLDFLGVKPHLLTASNHADVKAGAALTILPPISIAQSIVFHHPEIGSVDTTITGNIFSKYLQDRNDFTQLVNFISNNPDTSTESWYKKMHAFRIDPDTLEEIPVTPNEDPNLFADKKAMDWPVDPETGKKVIPQYTLSDEQTGATNGGVLGAATGVIYSVLRKIKNDEQFKGSLWNRSQATVSKTESNVVPMTTQAALARQNAHMLTAPPAGWSIKYDSSKQYGLDLFADRLSFSNNTVDFPVLNWPNRILGVYIEFQQADGTPIPWSVLSGTREGRAHELVKPNGPMSTIFSDVFAKQNDDTTKLFWGMLGSGNSIFGIPSPTEPTHINFKWPHDNQGNQLASKAQIYIGGLGAAANFKDWDTDVDLAGLVGTLILNYGITAISMAFTIAVVGPLKKKITSKNVKYAILGASVALGITAGAVSIAFWENGNAKTVFSKLGNTVAGVLFGVLTEQVLGQVYKKVIDELIAAYAAHLTTEQALGQIPFAGWALKVASVAADLASLAATTIECNASPATYKLQVQQTMDLTVTVKPDPRHGTEKQDPIWPMVASHYVITLKYPKNGKFEGGTTFVKSGPMPQGKEPIIVVFDKVPAGGQISMVANVYTSTDWLVGQWDSGPKSATADINGLLSYSGAIYENLVPLTPSTTYSEKQRIGYDNTRNEHRWILTTFNIDEKFKKDLVAAAITADFIDAFKKNGVALGAANQLQVKKITEGNIWELEDKQYNNTYTCTWQLSFKDDKGELHRINIQNKNRPKPPLPNPKTVPDTSGSNHNLAELVGMTINNKAYQLGYSWKASGLNMKRDNAADSSPVDTGQMYTMQSISTLDQPSELMIESPIGFSQMPFIAYNQFGLTPLLVLDMQTYVAELNAADGKDVPATLKTALTEKAFEIPDGAKIKLIKADLEWRIVKSTNETLFDLVHSTDVVNGKWVKTIQVFNYVVPETTNFYMDPRPDARGNYHLRNVSFNDGEPGKYKFDVTFKENENNSWGAFPIPRGSSLYKIAVHPAGCIIAIDYGLDKMWKLQLPNTATTAANANIAMPLSGTGSLEGLLSQPKAMTIAADGRIIILEQGNQRIQSLDVSGNPVASFKGSLSFTIPNSLKVTLNSKTVSDDLKKAYQSGVPEQYIKQPLSKAYTKKSATELDKNKVDNSMKEMLKKKLVELPEADADIAVMVNTMGQTWFITDKKEQITFEARWNQKLSTFAVYYAPTLEIEVVAPDLEWKLTDRTNSLTFEIKARIGEDKLYVQQLISTAPLRTQSGNVEYLDIAIEDKGYIYVLFHQGDGTTAQQYMLDIYRPDGTVLLNNSLTGIAAAKMAVDKWRTLWTLNYETFLGPNNRTEPGVSGWIPSTNDLV